jgi:hypothetical protein
MAGIQTAGSAPAAVHGVDSQQHGWRFLVIPSDDSINTALGNGLTLFKNRAPDGTLISALEWSAGGGQKAPVRRAYDRLGRRRCVLRMNRAPVGLAPMFIG